MQPINLSKNSVINLSKAAPTGLQRLLFGVNWGMVKSGGLFGIGSRQQAVDLDASITAFKSNFSQHVTKYFGNVAQSHPFMSHSGDDRSGDASRDDDDNETLTIDFTKVPDDVHDLFLYVNSFSNVQFDDIPYAGVRLYEGSPNNPTNILARFELANSPEFKGAKSIILGRCSRVNGEWQFTAIGQPGKFTRIDPTIAYIRQNYA